MTPVEDAALEEALLSTMMGNGEGPGANIQSLTREDFTCPVRARVYELLKEGRPWSDLETVLRVEGWEAGSIQYVYDVFAKPSLPRREIAPSVADLKRLRLIRQLCERVDAWRSKAPHLTYERAIRELGAAIRDRR